MKYRFCINDACILFLSVVIFLSGCDSEKKPNQSAFMESLDTTAASGPKISEEVIESILQQIPSPLEISSLLKEAGTDYDSKMLNSAEGVSSYNNNYKQAMNLGIYGTDLGYTNIFEKSADGLDYLAGIKSLADELNIGQFFDLGTIRKLAENRKNLDSLLLITTKNFNNINRYLQDQNRSNLSVLLLTGGWLEAMHITCQTYAKNPDDSALKETIGEQKIILENLIILLQAYENVDQNMAGLSSNMMDLKTAYDEVEIITIYRESTFEVVDGVMVIKDNSSSEVKITDENLKNISGIIASIRQTVIS
jgi:hypothetical protein